MKEIKEASDMLKGILDNMLVVGVNHLNTNDNRQIFYALMNVKEKINRYIRETPAFYSAEEMTEDE